MSDVVLLWCDICVSADILLVVTIGVRLSGCIDWGEFCKPEFIPYYSTVVCNDGF